MSILKKYARPSSKTLTEKYTTRISKEVSEQFEKWCKEFNLSPSEAIRLLIEEEMKRLRYESETKRDSMTTYDDLTTTNDYESRPRTTNVVKRQRTSTTGGRFSSNPWKINDELPCHFCGTWSKAANFKRDHIDKLGHGDCSSSEEFFNRYKEELDRMVEKRKNAGF